MAAAVISGNRNFEGRVHPLVKANFLASPPLVVAYALAGTVDIDLVNEPLGTGNDGRLCISKICGPANRKSAKRSLQVSRLKCSQIKYADVFRGSDMWKEIKVTGGDIYEWDENSTYIHHPPYFQELSMEVQCSERYQVGACARAVR